LSSSGEDQSDSSRRSFLLSSGGWLTGAWIAAHLPAIAAAAHHADHMPAEPSGAHLQFFSAGEAADVEALCSQIVPSGATPGAREAHALYFIDRSLATYFSAMASDYRQGLKEFQSQFVAAIPGHSFSAASPETQMAFLKTADQTPFFETTRMLTVLGMFSSPKYGGNYQGAGWKLLGFVDRHVFAPPFGYYDAEYKGFVPYAADHIAQVAKRNEI
jgi:gluconate 2-dehydrogenase gamma chain